MALETIITQIKTLVEGVSGIGVVNDYERSAVDKKKFMAQFCDSSDSNRINGWTITRQATEELRKSVNAPNGGRNMVKHGIVIRGYYSFQDSLASEKTFRQLVESIRSVLRQNYNLNGSCWKCDPPQNPVNEARQIAEKYLIHYAEIHLDVYEYITY